MRGGVGRRVARRNGRRLSWRVGFHHALSGVAGRVDGIGVRQIRRAQAAIAHISVHCHSLIHASLAPWGWTTPRFVATIVGASHAMPPLRERRGGFYIAWFAGDALGTLPGLGV